jgi:hypothetical protein
VKQSRRLLAALLGAAALLAAPSPAGAEPSFDEFKRFRALAIDLLGRMPTRDEVQAFRQPGFDLDGWIEAHLDGPDYARRLARVYLDRLRLRVNTTFNFPGAGLGRASILDENGRTVYVYYRHAQKRARDTKNGNFCFTRDEVGFDMSQSNQPGPGARVPQAQLDAYTVKVKPWWLYSDYASPSPSQRYNAQAWMFQWGFALAPAMLKEADGRDTIDVRVCREEANAVAQAAQDGTPNMVDCTGPYGYRVSSGCGCGVGLERCMPGSDNNTNGGGATSVLVSQPSGPLGVDPFVSTNFSYAGLVTELTTQEVERFMTALFAEDRDFREIVTGRWSYANGPLAQFYRAVQPTYWTDFARGYTSPTMLVDPSAMPKPGDLSPYLVNQWVRVPDRGPLAAGVLTMPVFLKKYATRRARAHIVYNAFLCKDFVAPTGLKLSADPNPDLTQRAGCQYCHTTLEPLAAYFGRVVENDWTWLDPTLFPTKDPVCKKGGKGDSACNTRYDSAFATMDAGMLRGVYATPDNADAGPTALAQTIAASPEFASCTAQAIAEDFLGRALTADDEPLKQKLTYAFVNAGYQPKALVRELLKSDAYLRANDLTSAAWRTQNKLGGGAP